MIHIAFDIAARARAEWQQRLQKEKERSAAEIARRVKSMLDIDVDEPTYPLTINDITFSLHNNGIYEALVILRPCPGCGNKMPSNAIHNYADLGFELQCAETLCVNCAETLCGNCLEPSRSSLSVGVANGTEPMRYGESER